MNKTFLLVFSLNFIFTIHCTKAQSGFTFADTYPENNIDSLENWLTTHPEPTQERLKNLIKLVRTYRYNGITKTSTQTDEIASLSKKNKVRWGELFSVYKRNSKESYNSLLSLKKEFEALNDTAGSIFTMSKLVEAHYDGTGIEIGNKNLTDIYLNQMEKLLEGKAISHSHIYYWWAKYTSLFGKPSSDNNYVKDFMEEKVTIISSNPKLQYALFLFNNGLATAYYYQNNYQKSYEIRKWILKKIHPKAIYWQIIYTQNLANDCEFLGKYEERIRLCQEVIYLIKKTLPSNLQILANAYISLKEEMYRKGLYKEAARYADSVIVLQDGLYSQNHRKDLLELQTKLEVQEKENNIADLNLEKSYIQKQNGLYATALLIGAMILGVALFLGIRLYKANQQLKRLSETREQFIRIISHDLRTPLNSFVDMGKVVAQLLRKNDTASVLKISKAIDDSSIKISQLLDNTLYWALAQKEKIVTNPMDLPLYAVHTH